MSLRRTTCLLPIARRWTSLVIEEARHDFEYALNEYVKFQMEHDTLNKDLERHGWEVKQRKAKGPEIDTLLRRTQLRNVFKKPEYRMIRRTTDLKATYA